MTTMTPFSLEEAHISLQLYNHQLHIALHTGGTQTFPVSGNIGRFGETSLGVTELLTAASRLLLRIINFFIGVRYVFSYEGWSQNCIFVMYL